MGITEDRTKYFWLPSDPVTPTEPAPATFDGSEVRPCFDMFEYAEQLRLAIDAVGTDPDPARNKGDFIYIVGWWLGFLGGVFYPDLGVTLGKVASTGPMAIDMTAFDLDPTASKKPLNELLKKKARDGVEVRTLGWIPYALMTTHAAPIPILGGLINPLLANAIQRAKKGRFLVNLSAQNMNATNDLRLEPQIGKNAMLNVLGHSAGSMHVKASLVGTRPDGAGHSRMVGFAGGIDLVTDRWAEYGHVPNPGWVDVPNPPFWHDMQARIQGKAAQGLYDHFRAMWNENLRREPLRFYFEGKHFYSYVAGATPVPERKVDLPLMGTPALTHHVQSLRTVPAFNYRWYNCLPEGQAARFAANGLFEIRAAWRKALLAAERYIYMEDQYFYSRELFEFVNTAIRSHAGLKVVVMMKGGPDPSDEPVDQRLPLHESINLGLLGIDSANELSPAQRNRIRIFQAFGDRMTTTDSLSVMSVTPVSPTVALVAFDRVTYGSAIPPDAFARHELYVTDGVHYWAVLGQPVIEPGTLLVLNVDTSVFPAPGVSDTCWLSHTYGVLIHAKTTIIDDKWALIGSPNWQRRSLYSDWEYAVTFLDEDEAAVRAYRCRLWAEHWRMPTPADLDIDVALGVWASEWNPAGTSPPQPARPTGTPAPPYVRPVVLPLTVPAKTPAELEAMLKAKHDLDDSLEDTDSRKPWGALCPPV